MRYRMGWIDGFLGIIATVGCGDDGTTSESVGDTGSASSTVTDGDGTVDDDGAMSTDGATQGSSPGDESGGGAEGSVEDGPCFGECTASLELLLPDGTEAFTILLQMDNLPDSTVQCPGGSVTGWLESRPDSVTCGPGSVAILVTDFEFPAVLTITVDDGEPQMIEPRWSDATVCTIACNEAVVQL